MILPIVSYGHRVLRKECAEIKKNYTDLKATLDNMWETLYAANGCGLAAPQVNLPVRIFIVDSKQVFDQLEEEIKADLFDGDKGIIETFINAQITEESEEVWKDREGCLSIPGISAQVERPWSITIEYLDSKFKKHTKTFSGLTARMIQHEYDHIEGVLYLDHLTTEKRAVLKPKLKKIKEGEVRPKYPMKFVGSKKLSVKSSS